MLTTTHAGVPGSVFLLAAIAVAWLIWKRTAFMRNLLAVGGDARAAFTAGVDVTSVRLIAYVLAGILAALVGLLFTAMMASSDPTTGTPSR